MSARLPNKWRQVPLPSLVTNHDGARVPVRATDRAKRHGDYPYYGASGIIDHIDEYLFDGEYLLIAEDGANLLSRSTPIAFIATGRFWVNNHAHVVQPRSGVSLRYLESFLNTTDLAPFVTGSAQPKLTQRALAFITVPLPPEAEQVRIVAKLDGLLARSKSAREELSHIPKLVARYKQAILSAAFQGDLTAEWRTQNSARPLKPARLEHVTSENIRNGLSVRGSDSPPGTRSLRLSALRSGVVDLSDVRYLPISDLQAERFSLREGDVLVSRGNGTKAFVGLAAIVRKISQPTIFPDTSFRLRLVPEKASPDWLTLIWNAPQVRTQIEDTAKTTAGIWKISQADLAKVELMLPSVEEQHEIVRLVDEAFSSINRLDADLERAIALVDRLDEAILAKAFRGELSLSEPHGDVENKVAAE